MGAQNISRNENAHTYFRPEPRGSAKKLKNNPDIHSKHHSSIRFDARAHLQVLLHLPRQRRVRRGERCRQHREVVEVLLPPPPGAALREHVTEHGDHRQLQQRCDNVLELDGVLRGVAGAGAPAAAECVVRRKRGAVRQRQKRQAQSVRQERRRRGGAATERGRAHINGDADPPHLRALNGGLFAEQLVDERAVREREPGGEGRGRRKRDASTPARPSDTVSERGAPRSVTRGFFAHHASSAQMTYTRSPEAAHAQSLLIAPLRLRWYARSMLWRWPSGTAGARPRSRASCCCAKPLAAREAFSACRRADSEEERSRGAAAAETLEEERRVGVLWSGCWLSAPTLPRGVRASCPEVAERRRESCLPGAATEGALRRGDGAAVREESMEARRERDGLGVAAAASVAAPVTLDGPRDGGLLRAAPGPAPPPSAAAEEDWRRSGLCAPAAAAASAVCDVRREGGSRGVIASEENDTRGRRVAEAPDALGLGPPPPAEGRGAREAPPADSADTRQREGGGGAAAAATRPMSRRGTGGFFPPLDGDGGCDAPAAAAVPRGVVNGSGGLPAPGAIGMAAFKFPSRKGGRAARSSGAAAAAAASAPPACSRSAAAAPASASGAPEGASPVLPAPSRSRSLSADCIRAITPGGRRARGLGDAAGEVGRELSGSLSSPLEADARAAAAGAGLAARD